MIMVQLYYSLYLLEAFSSRTGMSIFSPEGNLDAVKSQRNILTESIAQIFVGKTLTATKFTAWWAF